MIKAYIDPSSQVYYASFYIQGLYDSIGKPNISFSAKYFKDLRRNEGRTAYDVYFAFVLINDGVITKYVIDFADDASDINRSAYKWADIYAKVNINKSFTLFYAYNKIVDYNRIIQLPPYFGIKIWNSYQTIFYCITNYIKSLSNRSVGIHVHIKDYLLQYVHRSRLSYYETPSLKNNGNNYVFFASNLWNIENCNDTTNLIRERFIIACTKNKKIGVKMVSNQEKVMIIRKKKCCKPRKITMSLTLAKSRNRKYL